MQVLCRNCEQRRAITPSASVKSLDKDGPALACGIQVMLGPLVLLRLRLRSAAEPCAAEMACLLCGHTSEKSANFRCRFD